MNIPLFAASGRIRAIAARTPRALMLVLTATVTYVGTYTINSFLGGYFFRLEQQNEFPGGAIDRDKAYILWQPRVGYSAPYHSDFIGAAYLPLVVMDRR